MIILRSSANKIELCTVDSWEAGRFDETAVACASWGELTRDLFADKAGVTVRYWCERGKFTQ